MGQLSVIRSPKSSWGKSAEEMPPHQVLFQDQSFSLASRVDKDADRVEIVIDKSDISREVLGIKLIQVTVNDQARRPAIFTVYISVNSDGKPVLITEASQINTDGQPCCFKTVRLTGDGRGAEIWGGLYGSRSTSPS